MIDVRTGLLVGAALVTPVLLGGAGRSATVTGGQRAALDSLGSSVAGVDVSPDDTSIAIIMSKTYDGLGKGGSAAQVQQVLNAIIGAAHAGQAATTTPYPHTIDDQINVAQNMLNFWDPDELKAAWDSIFDLSNKMDGAYTASLFVGDLTKTTSLTDGIADAAKQSGQWLLGITQVQFLASKGVDILGALIPDWVWALLIAGGVAVGGYYVYKVTR